MKTNPEFIPLNHSQGTLRIALSNVDGVDFIRHGVYLSESEDGAFIHIPVDTVISGFICDCWKLNKDEFFSGKVMPRYLQNAGYRPVPVGHSELGKLIGFTTDQKDFTKDVDREDLAEAESDVMGAC